VILDLIRVGSSEQGTFGVLRIGQVPFALTLERPWRDNETNVSCIPPTEYICRRVHSPKFGETFEVQGVERRSHILFHKGNTIENTKGCILVGEQFDGTKLAHSGAGYGEFMAKLAGLDEFTLRILEV
jgi:hypothetical protein